MTKTYSPDPDKMPEAEVTLRLALFLLNKNKKPSHADLAIDGACVRCHGKTVFEIETFLKDNGCSPIDTKPGDWRGKYKWQEHTLSLQSNHGIDLYAPHEDKWVGVECKKGPLEKSKGRSPKNIIEEAIGQIITAETPKGSKKIDEYWVAVPKSPDLEKIGRMIVQREGFIRTGIKLVLVGQQDGDVLILN